jgi:hypothetical protein
MTIEFQGLPSEADIAEGVRILRRWHRRSWLVLATYLPVAGTLGVLLYSRSGSDWLSAVPAVTWLVAFAFSMIYANSLPCPRCRKPFRPMNASQVPWDPRCIECGLPLSKPPA